jgi:hypothetical protein
LYPVEPTGVAATRPVTADVADLLAGDPVAQLGDPLVRAADEADVVEGHLRGAADIHLEAGQVHRLGLAREGTPHSLLRIVALDRGKETDGAEVDAKTGTPLRAKWRSA